MILTSSDLAYLGAVLLISGTPGPNMLLSMTHGVLYGTRAAMATMSGLLIGLGVILGASLAGLGTLLVAEPRAFLILRLAGAAYLIYLGIKVWRAPVGALNVDSFAGSQGQTVHLPSLLERLRSGFLVSLSNPKALLFGMAFFPQFIDPSRPLPFQAGKLLGIFLVVESAWMLVYASWGARMAFWLNRPGRQQMFNRLSGLAFMAAGLMMLLMG